MVLGVIDWTAVITAAVPTVPATLAVLLANHTRKQIRTPSGDSIGHVVERTHDLAAVATMNIPTQAQDTMTKSVQRLNNDPESPVAVERRKTNRTSGADDTTAKETP
jgi:hypothetical protein